MAAPVEVRPETDSVRGGRESSSEEEWSWRGGGRLSLDWGRLLLEEREEEGVLEGREKRGVGFGMVVAVVDRGDEEGLAFERVMVNLGCGAGGAMPAGKEPQEILTWEGY